MTNTDKETKYLCGIGSFKPKWLQKFRNSKVYLIMFTLLGIFSGAQFTYFVGIISTLEKRFSFDSKATAVILMIGSLSPIVASVLVGYYGNHVHRPRFMTGGMLIVSLSSILNSLPYFVYGPATHISTSSNITKYQFCEAEKINSSCEVATLDSTVPALTIFSVCNFLCSIGATAFTTAGYPYMDDNVKKKNSPLYISASACFRILGPTFGFLLSSFCLHYSEDPFSDSDLPQTDPRFIGAWWMGFLLLGVLIFISSLPFVLFPRYLRESAERVTPEKSKGQEKKSNLKLLKNMPKDFWKMVKNPVFFWHNLSLIIKYNGFVGYYIFMPKYMENQYQQTASSASLFSGAASSLPLMFGSLFGGIIIRKLRPSPRLLTGGMLVMEIVFCLPGIVLPLFIGCPNIHLPTTTVMQNGMLNLTTACNRDCSCNQESFEPLCGPDQISTYFNPCYAGCHGYNETDDITVLTNCTCENENILDYVDMTSGYCESKCNYFYPFVIILAITDMFASTLFTGVALITLRCVPKEDKSFSVGLTDSLISLLTLIPSPLIFGALTDLACIVWEDKCGQKGNCWLYDNDKFRNYLHIPVIVLYIAGLFCQFFIFLYANRMKHLFDEEEQQNGDLKTMNSASKKDNERVAPL